MRSVRSRPKSQRQYVFNSAALDLVRKLPAAKPAPIPKYVEPLFATLWEHPPKGENWVHEIKFDGYRLQLHRDDNGIKAYTRRGHDWRDRVSHDRLRARRHQNTKRDPGRRGGRGDAGR
jgi:ATP-dependent DNA ligase